MASTEWNSNCRDIANLIYKCNILQYSGNLFIYLFRSCLSQYLIPYSVEYTVLVNNDLDRMWKKGAVAYFEVLYWVFSAGSDEKPQTLQPYQLGVLRLTGHDTLWSSRNVKMFQSDILVLPMYLRSNVIHSVLWPWNHLYTLVHAHIKVTIVPQTQLSYMFLW